MSAEAAAAVCDLADSLDESRLLAVRFVSAELDRLDGELVELAELFDDELLDELLDEDDEELSLSASDSDELLESSVDFFLVFFTLLFAFFTLFLFV